MKEKKKEVIIENYEGKKFTYPQPTNGSSKENILVSEKNPILDPCKMSA